MNVLGRCLVRLVAAVLFATTAHAQSKIDDCEKIQGADAYNQCLAKFGPPAKTGNLEPERPGDVKSSSAEAAAGASKAFKGKGRRVGHRHRGKTFAHRGRSGRAVRSSRGGRKRLTISVGK